MAKKPTKKAATTKKPTKKAPTTKKPTKKASQTKKPETKHYTVRQKGGGFKDAFISGLGSGFGWVGGGMGASKLFETVFD